MAKLSEEKVIDEIESKGFTVLELENYETIRSPFLIKCQNNHILETNLFSFRKDSFRCPKCDGGEIKITALPPEKSGYRILALDNATEKMGLSIYDNGKLVYYHLLVFSGNFDSRITKIFDVVTKVMIQEWKPDYIVMEDIQYQNNYQTYKKLAMLLGVLTVAAKSAGLDYRIIAPVQWRSHYQISGKRDDIKAKAVKLVNTMYNINVIDDVAEAILIGHYIADIKYQESFEPAF
jgi:Holliday junction resolvasome RuvABC endonuclease subunit